MRTAILIFALLGLTMATSMVDRFAEFKATYNKKYSSKDEEAKRFAIFEENMNKAAHYQASNPHATFGMNEYADVSAAEFKIRHNAEKYYQTVIAERKANPTPNVYSEEELKLKTKESMDWRKHGAVTYIRNQGQCGSCWSFGTVAGIEGQWFLAGHKLVALSEQEFVSCDTIDQGCNGGLPSQAMSWDLQARGGKLVTAASYPYVSGNGEVPACSWQGTVVAAQITGYKNLPQNEKQMAAWCGENGPITIGVDATSFQTYTGGILTNCISQQVDHCVAIVGYDLTNSPPYWIIKNSWGTSWGEQGYIRVEYGTDQCMITSGPIIATVAKAGPTPPPGPPTPTPPNPPPPVPTPTPPNPPPPPPPGKYFEQKVCSFFFCLFGCSTHRFPQDRCLQATGGGSVKAKCIPGGLLLDEYQSGDCSGQGQQSLQPTGMCFPTQNGEWAEDICPNGFTTVEDARSGNMQTTGFRFGAKRA